MNKPLLAVACCLSAHVAAAQHTFHVAPAAQGDGSSWDSPADLHIALAQADYGDAVWLRHGTYVTSLSGIRDVAFRIPDGVTVLGGFEGGETSASMRNPARHRSILSGEIGEPVRHDNAYTVLELVGAGRETRVDGVTVQGAYANGAGPTADTKRAGGGVLIRLDRPGTDTAPLFSDCTFADNYARDGGAVYIDARGGRASPQFVGCEFLGNEADLDGGAVYADARRRGEIKVSYLDCTFDGNVANYGGALFHQATKGTCAPRLTGCTFRQNRAYVRGANLYDIEHQGSSRIALVACVFEEEEPGQRTEDGVARGGD